MTKQSINRAPGKLKSARNKAFEPDLTLAEIKAQQEKTRQAQETQEAQQSKEAPAMQVAANRHQEVKHKEKELTSGKEHSGLFAPKKKEERVSHTISVSKKVWDRVENVRKENNLKHSSTVVERVLDEYLP